MLAVVLLFGITKSEALDVSEFKDPCEKAKCKKVEAEEEERREAAMEQDSAVRLEES